MTIKKLSGTATRASSYAWANDHVTNNKCPENGENGQRLYTMGEAAKHLGFTSRRALENLRFRGEGPVAIKLPSGGIRYSPAALAEWVGQNEAEEAKRLIWRASIEAEKRARRKVKDRERYLSRKRVDQGGYPQ